MKTIEIFEVVHNYDEISKKIRSSKGFQSASFFSFEITSTWVSVS